MQLEQLLTTASTITATNVTVSANNSYNKTMVLTYCMTGATGTQGLRR